MSEFNEKRGLEHIRVPAYSHEFNAVIERNFGTLLPMVRTALIASPVASCAPERLGDYGECFSRRHATLWTACFTRPAVVSLVWRSGSNG